MMKTLIVACLLLVPMTRPAHSQALRDPLLDRLIGTWVLRGTIASKETTHDVTFEWVLGRQYVRMHEVSREKDQKGQSAYEAIVYIGWDAASKRYACLWLDSTGGGGLAAQAIAYAPASKSELAFLFDLGGTRFHTTFRYNDAAGTWQWFMDGEEGGRMQPFARVTLTRR